MSGPAMGWGVEDLVVRFGRRMALDRVSLDVVAGAIAAVVGGDGAGKTTLLRVLAGAAEPYAGTVRRPPPERVGYMSAGPGVYRDLSVAENLSFVGAAYGLSRADVARRAEPLLARTGLTPARDRLAGNLSGGMRHKLALVMAMLHDPELLVLDEPTTGIDPVSRAELWRTIAAAAAGGAAVVFATTYLDEAERAGSVLVLDGGRAIATGSPDDVIARMPGAVFDGASRPAGVTAWRRGPRWRAWSPDGVVPAGAIRIEPDLQDAAIVASLASAIASRGASP